MTFQIEKDEANLFCSAIVGHNLPGKVIKPIHHIGTLNTS